MPQSLAFQKRGAPPAPPAPSAPTVSEPDGDEAAASDGVMVTCPGCGETFDAIQHLAGAPTNAAPPSEPPAA